MAQIPNEYINAAIEKLTALLGIKESIPQKQCSNRYLQEKPKNA
jgi:hypothetical protein